MLRSINNLVEENCILASSSNSVFTSIVSCIKNFQKIKNNINLLNKKLGFTLAEVLITLGIIGVVAAMTIPTLITKINNMHYRAIYKKTYSSLNQSLRYMQEDSVAFDLSPEYTSDDGVKYTSQIGKLFQFIATHYYKSTQICFKNNADKCWVCKKGEAGAISGGAPKWLGCGVYNPAFIDANGVAYYLYSKNENIILIDVNNFGGPNQLGRDRFLMYFSDSSDPRNYYPKTVDSIKPWHNIYLKERWCPQGNCLYSSWIRGNK